MSAAYAAFSNGGYYNEPYAVDKIVFRDTGRTKKHEGKKTQVMSDATAFMISSVLQDVSITGGKPANVAAKTGTTNYDDNTVRAYGMPGDAIRDSWVVGYTTKTVIGMWYGYDSFTRESVREGYVLRNIPATIQKDRLFLALANAAFEKDKASFKMPDSVVKANIGESSEYFKKGHEPKNSHESVKKLATPSGFKVTYSGNKITMSWNPVPRLGDDESYGDFGYNVYQGNTLLDFVTKSSYSFTTANPYTTYKVVATYKSYSGAQSDPATFTFKEDKKELYCGDKNRTSGTLIPTGDACSFSVNGTAVTDATITISNSTCGETTFADEDLTDCTVTYSVTYGGKVYTIPIKYSVSTT